MAELSQKQARIRLDDDAVEAVLGEKALQHSNPNIFINGSRRASIGPASVLPIKHLSV